MSPRLVFAALTLIGVAHAFAAPPPWEAKKLKLRESYRSFTGVLAPGDAVDKVLGKPCKLIPLKLFKGGLYVIELKSTAFEPVLRIAAGDVEVARNGAVDAKTKGIRVTFLPPRDLDYNLVVSASDDKFGGYVLSVTPKGRPGETGVQLLEGDSGVKGRFPLKAIKGKAYAIDLLALDAPLRLELVSDKDKVVAMSAEHDGNKTRARFDFIPEEEGAYELRLSPAEAEKGGKFLLRIGETRGPMGLLVMDKGAVSVEEKLTSEDAADTKRKTPCKIFPIKLQAGVAYVIDLESTAFDAFLRLEGPDGKEIAWNDDGGIGNNARIEVVARADGVYRIVATCFARATGAFTLKVREAKKK